MNSTLLAIMYDYTNLHPVTRIILGTIYSGVFIGSIIFFIKNRRMFLEAIKNPTSPVNTDKAE